MEHQDHGKDVPQEGDGDRSGHPTIQSAELLPRAAPDGTVPYTHSSQELFPDVSDQPSSILETQADEDALRAGRRIHGPLLVAGPKGSHQFGERR